MTYEFIYDGEKQVGVRLFNKAEEAASIMRMLDNNDVSQMEIRLMAMWLGVETP